MVEDHDLSSYEVSDPPGIIQGCSVCGFGDVLMLVLPLVVVRPVWMVYHVRIKYQISLVCLGEGLCVAWMLRSLSM